MLVVHGNELENEQLNLLLREIQFSTALIYHSRNKLSQAI